MGDHHNKLRKDETRQGNDMNDIILSCHSDEIFSCVDFLCTLYLESQILHIST